MHIKDEGQGMRKFFVAIAIALSASTSVTAQTTFGGADCGQWVKNQSSAQKQWLMGYMSGLSAMHVMANLEPADPLDKVDSADQMFLWVDIYCKEHPLQRVGVAGWLLFQELKKK